MHWSDLDESELGGEQFALMGDQFPFGDCWQMTDFAAHLGFPWPFGQMEDAPAMKPPLPTLGEILAQNLPRMPREESLVDISLLRDLPSALSPEEIRRWGMQEKGWQRQAEPRWERDHRDYEEQKRREKEREAERLRLILEKRRKRGKH